MAGPTLTRECDYWIIQLGHEAQYAEAADWNARALGWIGEAVRAGCRTPTTIAEHIIRAGHTARRGGPFNSGTVDHILRKWGRRHRPSATVAHASAEDASAPHRPPGGV